MSIRIGCQTYTWEMLGESWEGRVDDILNAISSAGYAGIEIATPMLREYRDRPGDFARAVRDRGLELASVAHSAKSGWTVAAERDAELALAGEIIEWTRAAGCTLIGLGGAASTEPQRDRREKLEFACELYNEIGTMASRAGIRVHLHPHSHSGSIIESVEEYEYLLQRTDPAVTWFGPDVGHMMRSGLDYLALLAAHRDRLLHLHMKDVRTDNSWAPLGEGTCDIGGVINFLSLTRFDGWLILEEESEAGWRDQLSAIRHNRDYMRKFTV